MSKIYSWMRVVRYYLVLTFYLVCNLPWIPVVLLGWYAQRFRYFFKTAWELSKTDMMANWILKQNKEREDSLEQDQH